MLSSSESHGVKSVASCGHTIRKSLISSSMPNFAIAIPPALSFSFPILTQERSFFNPKRKKHPTVAACRSLGWRAGEDIDDFILLLLIVYRSFIMFYEPSRISLLTEHTDCFSVILSLPGIVLPPSGITYLLSVSTHVHRTSETHP